MNLPFTNFIAIFGITSAVVSFAPTAFSASNQFQARSYKEIWQANREITQTPGNQRPDTSPREEDHKPESVNLIDCMSPKRLRET
jgi:hypothetical protein